MKRARSLLIGLAVWVGWIGAVKAQGPDVRRPVSHGELPATGYVSKSTKLPLPVGLETLPANMREAILKVMRAPTITAVGPAEEFCASGEMYVWLLDHPDRVSLAWRRLNVEAVDICPLDGGRFNWKDDQGSELTWRTVSKNGDGRIWYAEGKVRPGQLLPLVPVRAVAVLRHGVKQEDAGTTIRHQLEVYLQTDSKAASLVMRMLGPTAPRLAEQGAEQLQLFFSGIAKYVEKHPTKAQKLLADKK